ncbi:MAG: ABC transporter ATP-binding protein [Acholeplasmatales bacterium]|jgi:multiple sugar transport system ATP-binding protein|nr:ABC transporter ATP-binding protein [Acholeplasmatales bacterium]
MANVVLKNIQKVYLPANVHVVKGFDLEIKDEEFIVLVGGSGCGKTTTLRMIAGLEEITSGELYIDGVLSNDVPPSLRNIAMVFQNYALFPHMSVYKNIAFPLQLKRVPKDQIEEKVQKVASLLGLSELLKRKPKELSGGQRQRVAVGRAIIKDSKLLLMDEPLSNLDAKLRVQMRSEIIKLHEELKKTIIYVTHDQVEAMTMATRIVIMDKGVIQQVDTPENVYKYPSNLFVAGFIGTPSMNFISCVPSSDGYLYITKNLENKETIFSDKTDDNKEYKLKLTDPQFKLLKQRDYINKKVILGIRPEDVKTAPIKTNENTIKVKINICELLGAEYNLMYYISGNLINSKASLDKRIISGMELEVNFNIENAHLFETESSECVRICKEIEKPIV